MNRAWNRAWLRRSGVAAVLLASGTPLCSAHAQSPTRAEFTEVHMGVPVRIVLHAPDEEMASVAARAAYARIAELDAIMSDFRAGSEVRRLSGTRGAWTPVSAELLAVLTRSLEIARLSDGAFDPTVGPLVALWRQARREGRLPDSAALARARARVGWHGVQLDPSRHAVRFARDGMQLDLGGIAKGYILQQALASLRARGVSSALLDAGGDLLLGDAPPGSAGWRVTIAGRDTLLSAVAVATSGPTEQFVEIGGARYSHVIDVRTGLGTKFEGPGRIVTVIADDGATADAVATALAVPGRAPNRRLEAIRGVRRVVVGEAPFPDARE